MAPDLNGFEFTVKIRVLDDAADRGELLASESMAAALVKKAVEDAIEAELIPEFEGNGFTEVDISSDVISR